jgi:hypothetical protein
MSKHKDAAQAFLKMAGASRVREAYDQYIAPSFIHHNQFFTRRSPVAPDRDAGRVEGVAQQIDRDHAVL